MTFIIYSASLCKALDVALDLATNGITPKAIAASQTRESANDASSEAAGRGKGVDLSLDERDVAGRGLYPRGRGKGEARARDTPRAGALRFTGTRAYAGAIAAARARSDRDIQWRSRDQPDPRAALGREERGHGAAGDFGNRRRGPIAPPMDAPGLSASTPGEVSRRTRKSL
ncbi:MAG TPA: hypothetical protein VLK65_05355 [Vicinamibacteria bacterium]|nr:hypothetical protein [Vicinamibacteria bacterium]